MTMHINLSPEMESFIKAQVASGFYGNATEVIRDAVRRLQADNARIQAFRAAVKAGDDQLDRGQGIPFSAALMDEVEREALAAARRGDAIDPDVAP